jgi:Uma2 family endonuclease
MQAQTRMTLDEYLADSPGWDEKFEWVNGELVAMSGGRPVHAAVAMNIGASLALRLRGTPCRPTSSDQRVHVPDTGACFYPDVTVICGRYELAPADPTAVVNPAVIVEVISPSTEHYDRGAKFEHYRRLASLRDFVLVDPDARHVIHLARTADGWLRRDLTDGAVALTGVAAELPLDEIFGELDNVPR